MNLFVIIILVILVGMMAQGYKRGMVKEIISFVSLILLCIIVVLIGSGLQSYMQKEVLGVVAAVLLLALLGIAHHLMNIFFFSAKMITKLPVISWLDKILGIVAGIAETVLILWTIYALIMTFGLGMLGQQILAYTEENTVLIWLYQNNYLAVWISKFSSNFSFLH